MSTASKAFHAIANVTDRAAAEDGVGGGAFQADPVAFIVNSVGDHMGTGAGLLAVLLEDAETISGLLSESLANKEFAGSEYQERGVLLLGRKLQLARHIAVATHAAALEGRQR